MYVTRQLKQLFKKEKMKPYIYGGLLHCTQLHDYLYNFLSSILQSMQCPISESSSCKEYKKYKKKRYNRKQCISVQRAIIMNIYNIFFGEGGKKVIINKWFKESTNID